MNRASGGKPTNQILLFPRLYKSKGTTTSTCFTSNKFSLSFTKFASPRLVLLFYSNNCLHMLNLCFYYFFFRKLSGQKISIQEWLWKCNAKHMIMVLQKLTKFYVGSASGLFIFCESKQLQMFWRLGMCILHNQERLLL